MASLHESSTPPVQASESQAFSVRDAETAQATQASNTVDEDDRLGSSRIIQDNAPLPRRAFPSTDHVQAKQSEIDFASLRPMLLPSRNELARIIDHFSLRQGFSNFSDALQHRQSASLVTLPSLQRFSALRLAEAIEAKGKLIRATRSTSADASQWDLHFPIRLSITDGRRIPLPGMSITSIQDSQGYPLFHDATRDRQWLGIRSSGAFFTAGLSKALVARIGVLPDASLARAWSHMFHLSDDKDATAILLQRVKGAAVGDNHIALLLKAYLAYFDSVAAGLEDVHAARNAVSAASVVIEVSKSPNWVSSALASNKQIVNVLGGPVDYQEFWAYCCFDKPPIYSRRTDLQGGSSSSTVFSHYQMPDSAAMTCVCDSQAFLASREPAFWGRPQLILGFIEMYVQRYALQRQANEALQMAAMWPTLCSLSAPVALPRPFHTVDWLGGEVERSSLETPYSTLVGTDPLVILASTLATNCAIRSQVYDYVSLLTCDRSSWGLSSLTIKAALSWLTSRASAPGVGWNFLLKPQFNISNSFLYLAGLASVPFPWQRFLEGFKWTEDQFPAHLRLLQPFTVPTSTSCILPWEAVWMPNFDINDTLLTAEPFVIMQLLRLGVLSPGSIHDVQDILATAIYPLLDRKGTEVVGFEPIISERLRVIREHGLRVLAVSADTAALSLRDKLHTLDAQDADTVRTAWNRATGVGPVARERLPTEALPVAQAVGGRRSVDDRSRNVAPSSRAAE